MWPAKGFSHICTYIHSSPNTPLNRLSHNIDQSSLCYTVNPFCCSVVKSCLTLYDAMDCSTPGFLVLHYLLEFSQTHVHEVYDAIQSSHPCCPPLLLPSIFPMSESFPMSHLLASGFITHFKYRSVYTAIPNSLTIPFPTLSPH